MVACDPVQFLGMTVPGLPLHGFLAASSMVPTPGCKGSLGGNSDRARAQL